MGTRPIPRDTCTDPEVYYYTSGTLNSLHGTIGTENGMLNGLHGTVNGTRSDWNSERNAERFARNDWNGEWNAERFARNDSNGERLQRFCRDLKIYISETLAVYY
jgi:hypothetical protein